MSEIPIQSGSCLYIHIRRAHPATFMLKYLPMLKSMRELPGNASIAQKLPSTDNVVHIEFKK